MAYQTGTASSPIDLVQKMAAWLVSIGWNLDMSQADAPGWRVHLDKGGNYVHLYASMNQSNVWAQGMYNAFAIFLYMSSGFDGGQPWNNQPGNPPVGSGQTYTVGVGIPLMTGGAIQNYYFFSDAADNVILVVERTPGLYVHLGWGPSLNKTGAWTGGPYFFGTADGYYTGYQQGSTYQPHPSPGYFDSSSCPGADSDYLGSQCTYIRIDVDSFTGKWIGISNNTGAAQGYTGQFGRSSVQPSCSSNMEYNIAAYGIGNMPPPYGYDTYNFQWDQTSQQDGRANLLPVLLWTRRDIGDFSIIGTIPNVFLSNGVGNGFSNASEYVIGTTTYKMFPNFAVIKQ